MPHSSRENEIKLPVSDIAAARRLLAANGFRIKRRRVFERNLVFDNPAHELRAHGKLLRLRQAGRRATLTFKGPASPGKHKSREEREVGIAGLPEFQAILERLGFTTSFIYEKYRTEFAQPGGEGVATLDETPIATFLELEGPPEWVDRIAALLGYSEPDYITLSYGALYQDFRERAGKLERDMCFPKS
ncbi:MAG: class IV adenylate cyclase [Acidobacteriota bacterium]|nr:class IV adenylate cyclase [Acidobacteriota bacterium]